jgi:hypothetical protein
MATMNNPEDELDAIRDEIYEETKHMTCEERTRLFNERGEKLAAQYGFTLVKSADVRGYELPVS